VTRFESFKSDPIGRAVVDALLVGERAARGGPSARQRASFGSVPAPI